MLVTISVHRLDSLYRVVVVHETGVHVGLAMQCAVDAQSTYDYANK